MRQRNIAFFAAALFASLASGQGPDQVLSFSRNGSVQGLQEIANAIRAVTGVSQASLDADQRTLALRGDAVQLAAAAWLFHELDGPGAQVQPSAAHEYRSSGDDVMRVFYLANARTPQAIQELTNLTRAVLEIQRMFPIVASGALVWRDTAERDAAADWLVKELDRPPGSPAAPQQTRTYRFPAGGYDVLRVLYLGNGQTSRDVQEMVNGIRGLMDLQRVFPYSPQTALVMRGTETQAAGAEWLHRELDRPALSSGQPAAQDPAVSEFRMPADTRPGSNETAVRVFRVTHADTPQELQAIWNAIRTKCPRTFVYSPQRAVLLRGTDLQAAEAERVIKELGDPNSPKAPR